LSGLHEAFGLGEIRLRMNGAEIARHDVRNWDGGELSSLKVRGHTDIAIRDDADRVPIVVYDRHGSAIAFPHDARGFIGRIPDSADVWPIGHEFFDLHGISFHILAVRASHEVVFVT